MTSLPSKIQEYLQQKMSLALHYHIQLSGNYLVYVNKNGIFEESLRNKSPKEQESGNETKKNKKTLNWK